MGIECRTSCLVGKNMCTEVRIPWIQTHFPIYVVIYNCVKFECGKWRTTVTATTYTEAVPAFMYLVSMWSTVNGGLPLLALPFFRVVYADTDAFSMTTAE